MKEHDGYRRLAVQVLLRAFQDSSLFVNNAPRANLGPGRRMPRPSQIPERDRSSSITFLQNDNTMLSLWCAWLDISVEELQERWKASLSL
jgi:hypothetical protein